MFVAHLPRTPRNHAFLANDAHVAARPVAVHDVAAVDLVYPAEDAYT